MFYLLFIILALAAAGDSGTTASAALRSTGNGCLASGGGMAAAG
jgi:hypothetical protein